MNESETTPEWEALHDRREAQAELEAFERLEERLARRLPTPQEREEERLEGLDAARGRSGLHVKHGVHAENMSNGNYTTQDLRRLETFRGTHYRGIGDHLCPISAVSIFDCHLPTCDHPAPGE